MKLFTAIVFCSLVVGVSSESWYSFFKEAVQGTGDLLRAYWDMQFTSSRNSNRYFYARGNYEAAQRGTGGIWVAKIISNSKKYFQMLLHQYYYKSGSKGLEDLMSNQRAEEWGRSGKDPNHFRPDDLPQRY